MDWSRLPCQFLTSWVDAPCRKDFAVCRKGRALSYGHDLEQELQQIGDNLNMAAGRLGF
jgi:hypothetical protein